MSGVVSIPEKTLEHWSSQYLMYRYRSKAALWWPSSGEDIDVNWFPARPGKAVQLELKTTTVAGAGVHEVLIDLGQLWEYRCKRTPGRRPFYVFPWPGWRGNLAATANSHGIRVTELAFARSGPSWWFADWMAVLTTDQVANVLGIELIAHNSTKRGKKKPLVRFDLTESLTDPTVTWGAGREQPGRIYSWREFWSKIERCGEPGWPQLIMLPAALTGGRRHFANSEAFDLLAQAATATTYEFRKYRRHSEYYRVSPDRSREAMQTVTFEPEMRDGVFQLAAAEDGEITATELDSEGVNETEEHRQAVFLDTDALSFF